MMKATGAGDCAVNRTPETRNGWEWTKDSSAERRQRRKRITWKCRRAAPCATQRPSKVS